MWCRRHCADIGTGVGADLAVKQGNQRAKVIEMNDLGIYRPYNWNQTTDTQTKQKGVLERHLRRKVYNDIWFCHPNDKIFKRVFLSWSSYSFLWHLIGDPSHKDQR